jgi:hypothetical protein
VLAAEVAPDDIYRDHFNCSPAGGRDTAGGVLGKTPCRFMRVKDSRTRVAEIMVGPGGG